MLAVPEHPPAFVTVTEYVPLELTMMDCVFAPVDQRYDVPALAVRITPPPGSQTFPVMLIVGTGFGLIVTGNNTGVPHTTNLTKTLPPGPCQSIET